MVHADLLCAGSRLRSMHHLPDMDSKGTLAAFDVRTAVGWLVPRALRHFILITAILGVLSQAWIRIGLGGDRPLRSDGYTYYVYVPSWLIFHDTTLDSVARDCCGGTFDPSTGIVRWPETGRFVNRHPIGVAVQMLPFLVVADALTRWSNLPRDGFSIYYQQAAALAGLAYLLAGLAILRGVLLRRSSPGIVLATLVVVTFGTNLFHYGTFEPTFSHAFSFCLVAALVSLTERWWEAPRWKTSLALGFVLGLLILTRHPNAIFAAFFPLYGVTSWQTLRANAAQLWARRVQLSAMIAVTAAMLAPQFAIYHAATGHWMVNSYGEHGFTFWSPHLLGVLFGTEKGLFFWSPALLFAVAGIIVARGWYRMILVPTLFVIGVDTYLIASWWDWQFGDSYGHRAFTDALSLAAVFIAAFFEWAARRPRLAPDVAIAALLATALSVVQMIQFWFGLIPPANTTWDQYRELFLRWH